MSQTDLAPEVSLINTTERWQLGFLGRKEQKSVSGVGALVFILPFITLM